MPAAKNAKPATVGQNDPLSCATIAVAQATKTREAPANRRCRADRMMAHAIYGREHDRIRLLFQCFRWETFNSQNWHIQRIEP